MVNIVIEVLALEVLPPSRGHMEKNSYLRLLANYEFIEVGLLVCFDRVAIGASEHVVGLLYSIFSMQQISKRQPRT